MSMLWIAVLALAASPGEEPAPPVATAPSSAARQVAVPPRSGRELQEATRAALRRWARAGDADANIAAVEFLALYRELQQDTRLSAKQREELRNKVRGRLAHLALQISKVAAKEAKNVKTGPKSVEVAKDGAVLGQMGMGFNQQGMGMGMGGGGAGMPGSGMAADNDAGQDLVDLIQKTICPQTWDVNGGPSAIYYWKPQRALVIAAPDDVHDQLRDTLEQLERANR
jgi:hypothetical protein